MSTGTQGVKSPKDYLSPEAQQELERSKEAVQQEFKTFINPPTTQLAALIVAKTLTEIFRAGLVDKTETEKFLSLIVRLNSITTKLANEAYENYQMEQAVNSGTAQEA